MSQETNVIIMVHPTKNQLSEINPQIPSQRKAQDCGTGMKSREVNIMAIQVVKFSNGGCKIKKIFALELTYSKEMIEF